jgi:hypothetical protein
MGGYFSRDAVKIARLRQRSRMRRIEANQRCGALRPERERRLFEDQRFTLDTVILNGVASLRMTGYPVTGCSTLHRVL